MTNISWWRTSLGDAEIERMTDAIRHEHVSQGPVTAEFERTFAELIGAPFAVATTSCSVALFMALMAAGIGLDDEVLVPNRTFIATAHAAQLLGAQVVLVDTLPDLPLMDIDDARRKISSRTKAIMPVHLNGRAVDMAAVASLAQEHGLTVVEDAAQAMFSRSGDKYLGTFGNLGCFSLGMTKLISTGQGGVVVTADEHLYGRLQLLKNHGVKDTFQSVYQQLGFNFKFTDILAAIGIEQLRRVETRARHSAAIYNAYIAAEADFSDYLRIIPVDVAAGELPLWVEGLSPEREQLMAFLAEQGIETRRFHPGLHESPHLANECHFPHSEIYGEQGLWLPCGPSQPLENIEPVLNALRRYGRR